MTQIARVDEKTRTVYFAAPWAARRGRIRTSATCTASVWTARTTCRSRRTTATTSVQLSPSGRYLIDTYSTCEMPPVVVLRDGEGKLVMPLEKTDISQARRCRLEAARSPFSVKARDGKTDLYGMLFRPTSFDPAKKYPIINNAYPGPQSGSVGSRSFAAARGDKQALAELGFVVVSIDGMGTPGRSKSFHDAYYGAMGRDNTLPDQVAGMKELAQRYPVDRHRPRGDLGPFRGRVHRRRCDVPLPRLLQGRHLGVGQPRPARVRGRLG